MLGIYMSETIRSTFNIRYQLLFRIRRMALAFMSVEMQYKWIIHL